MSKRKHSDRYEIRCLQKELDAALQRSKAAEEVVVLVVAAALVVLSGAALVAIVVAVALP
jgi:hypothetical protein